MKKLILILALVFALAFCFAACCTKKNNVNSHSLQEKTNAEDPSVKDNEVNGNTEVNPPDFLSDELVSTLVEYLQNIYAHYYAPDTSYAAKIDKIKQGYQPLHVKFNSEEYYFVCGYYNATHQNAECEDIDYCCVTEYTWVRFDNETEILEYYDEEKLVVAFQINKSLFVKDALSDNSIVPDIEHFQIYKVSFENGKNINVALDFDDTFIYLNSSDKIYLYHSVFLYNHDWITFPCVELHGEYYIIIRTHTLKPNGDVVDNGIDRTFGDYYDVLIGVMEDKKYSELHEKGYVFYYGLFDIEEFIRVVCK